MPTKDQRCHNNEFWDKALGGCESCAIPCTDRNPFDCKVFCPEYYEKYYGSTSTITPIMTPETSDSPAYTGLVAGLVIIVCVALLAIGVAICRCCYRRKRKDQDGRTLEADAGVYGETIQYPTLTGGETNKLLSDSNPDHTNKASHILREKPNGMTVAAQICGSNTGNTSNRLSSMMSHLRELNIPRNQGNGDNRPSAMMEMHRNQGNGNTRPSANMESHRSQGNGNTGASANIDSHRTNQGNGNAGPSANIDSHRTNQGNGNTGPSANIDSHRTNQGNGNTGPSANIDSYRTNQGNGNTGPSANIDSHRTNQGNGNTGPSANIDLHRVNQGTASGGPPSLGELAQNPAADPVVLPTSRPGDFGMSQDPTPMNPVSSLRESRGLIQNPVQATSEPPSDIPGSGIPSLHLQVYGAFPPEVADRWDDLSLHSDHEENLNLVSDEEDLDPLSGDPGSLQLDLRSGIEYAPESQPDDNMDHWVVVEQMSGTGGVSTGAVLRGCERMEEHAIHMPWFRICRITGHKLEIHTNLGSMAEEEEVRQLVLEITGLPPQALVFHHQYPAQESIDSLFGDSGLA